MRGDGMQYFVLFIFIRPPYLNVQLVLTREYSPLKDWISLSKRNSRLNKKHIFKGIQGWECRVSVSS